MSAEKIYYIEYGKKVYLKCFFIVKKTELNCSSTFGLNKSKEKYTYQDFNKNNFLANIQWLVAVGVLSPDMN